MKNKLKEHSIFIHPLCNAQFQYIKWTFLVEHILKGFQIVCLKDCNGHDRDIWQGGLQHELATFYLSLQPAKTHKTLPMNMILFGTLPKDQYNVIYKMSKIYKNV